MRRRSKQRDAIMEVLQAAARPMAPAELLHETEQIVKTISLATVYRTINQMVETGHLVAVPLPGGPDRYELVQAAREHHHHFHCDKCDRVFDVDGCPDDLHEMLPDGFSLREHEIMLYGVCSECACH